MDLGDITEVHVQWHVRHEHAKKERIWSPEVIVKHNGFVEKTATTCKGYLLRYSELLALLNASGD